MLKLINSDLRFTISSYLPINKENSIKCSMLELCINLKYMKFIAIQSINVINQKLRNGISQYKYKYIYLNKRYTIVY